MQKLCLVSALTLGLLCTSCLGSYNAFRGVSSWNTRATDSKWWNGLIHFGFWIIPVYPLTLTGDFLIFNTFEFFGGNNPIGEPDPPSNPDEVSG